jgi:hypothetical protein
VSRYVESEWGVRKPSTVATRHTFACMLALSVSFFAYASGDFDGKWGGKTSQDKAVSFEIQQGTLKSFALEWRVTLDEPCATAPGSAVALVVLGGKDVFFFPYTQKEFQDLKSRGETRIDPSTVGPTAGPKGFTFNRNIEGKARVSVIATTNGDGSMSGTLTITAIACKGIQKLSWDAHKEK